MKKQVIAVMLSMMMAVGSVGGVSVFAAERNGETETTESSVEESADDESVEAEPADGEPDLKEEEIAEETEQEQIEDIQETVTNSEMTEDSSEAIVEEPVESVNEDPSTKETEKELIEIDEPKQDEEDREAYNYRDPNEAEPVPLDDELPKAPNDGKEFWVFFREGYRNDRIEMSSFNLDAETKDRATILWDRNLTVKGSSIKGDCNQYYLNADNQWEQIGTYPLITDWATSVIASNLYIYDSSGHLIYGNPNSESDDFQSHRMGNFEMKTDSWSFLNHNWAFAEYEDGALKAKPLPYSIPSTRYVDVFGIDYLRIASSSNQAYQSMIPSDWGGNCFGMAMSAAEFDLGRIPWRDYADDEFSSVNDYYSEIRQGNINYGAWFGDGLIYTTSGHFSDVTHLIENYQIWQHSEDAKETKIGDGETGFLIDKGKTETGKEIRHTYSHNTSGKYINDVFNIVKEANEPLLFGIVWADNKGKTAGHALLAYAWEKEDWTQIARYGWYKIYVYDCNFPMPNEAMKNENQSFLRPYTTTEQYLELNPSQNKWRYATAGTNASSSYGCIGCDENGSVIVRDHIVDANKTDDGKKHVESYPDELLVFKPSLAPSSFNGTAKFTTKYGSNIRLAPDSNITVIRDGNVIASVREGNCVCLDNDVTFDGICGFVLDSDTISGGILHIPYEKYTIAYEEGDDVTVIGTDNITNLMFNGKANIQVDTTQNSIDITSESDNEMSVQLTNYRKTGDFTSVQLEGHLGEGDSANVELHDDDLVVAEADSTTGTVELDVSTTSSNSQDKTYIDTIDNEEQYAIDLKPYNKTDISSCTVNLSSKRFTYTGKDQKPTVVVNNGSQTLVEQQDYIIQYNNNNKPGTATVSVMGIGDYTGTVVKSFTIVLGKTIRGDMFNLANNVKVTWKEVPGAKYYKVYREGITDKKESREEPVIVTQRLIGWDKEAGLTNGHAYRYKIVASLTGKDDLSGDSPLSYSKLMYRLKTVVIRSVKNTAPGKVTVKYDKTTSGDSYVLQYCEREDMVGAKTKVVLGANNTSYTIGGLKKGKTYYISIRVRKKVNGIDYYTTFGVPKKINVVK